MVLRFYNTLTRKKEEFKEIVPGQVGLYCCGPTVYWHQHIGNLRTFVFEDVLKRVLVYNGFKVKHVINVTDVGHLTSDADDGEDKLVKALKREGLPLTKESMLKLSDIYFTEFKEDINKLNIISPDVWCKATEHVEEMKQLIERIEQNGYVYKTSVGLIFDTAKFNKYAELGRLKLDEQEEGARGKKDDERKRPSDFALWLMNQPNHIMQWESKWGKGFPGWHIECSAMSMKYLGEQFDIHCGGKEHISVHHTNEIAQSEGATGKKWVNFWLHAEWLVVPDGKMSKSKGSFHTVNDLIKKEYDPLAFRYLCFTAHYKKPLTFSWEAMDAAKNSYENFKNRIIEIKVDMHSNVDVGLFDKYKKEFKSAINDDMNLPIAMSVAWAVMKDGKLGNKEKYDLLLNFDSVFGFGITSFKKEKVELTDEQMVLVKQREDARKNKDWELSDKIRDQLLEQGIKLVDSSEGNKIEKK